MIADSAKGFVVAEAKQRLADQGEALKANPMAEKALGLLKAKLGARLEGLSEETKRLDQFLADYLAVLCGNPQCDELRKRREEFRQSLTSAHESGTRQRIGAALLTVEGFLKGKTEEILAKLIMDVRIFSGTNLATFGLLLLVAGLVPRDRLRPLMLPAGCLLAASALSISLYLFGQNWFFTILHNQYWGFGYSALVGGIFLLLLDVALNEARITGSILDAFWSVISKALSPIC
ncbi:hypothetical protein ACFSM5_02565 [Lacibacterium aquatile]|uniref:Uncharacterized protein n=1 Tax=Lacibacterium aquatile TaxID=1168082 RepID=A0ABW5DLH1_9PROT